MSPWVWSLISLVCALGLAWSMYQLGFRRGARMHGQVVVVGDHVQVVGVDGERRVVLVEAIRDFEIVEGES